MNWAEIGLRGFLIVGAGQTIKDYRCGRDSKKVMWHGLLGVATMATLMWFAGLFH